MSSIFPKHNALRLESNYKKKKKSKKHKHVEAKQYVTEYQWVNEKKEKR